VKPMRFLGFSGAEISSRIASKTALNCVSYLLSSLSSHAAKSLFAEIISLSFTKARIIMMFTATARALLSTPESMAIPCSVKQSGAYRILRFDAVTDCDRIRLDSDTESRNMKSGGNLRLFLLTAWLKAFVDTP